jgi:lysophospholipase L1-like esterase
MQHLSKQILKSSREIEILPKTHSPSSSSWDDVIFVACAGENDVSHGTPIDATMASFEQAVEQIFALPSPQIEVQQEHRMQPPPTRMHLIFIGPKVEPWMTRDESDARKGYFQLSQRLEQTIANRQKQFGNSTEIYHSIHYIDCLIRFCGDTKDLSVFGGGTIADSVFFDCDELHLSEKGYAVLKDEVELILDHIVKSR